jgi:hypothetical protein
MKEIRSQYFEDEFKPEQNGIDIIDLEEKTEELPVIKEDDIFEYMAENFEEDKLIDDIPEEAPIPDEPDDTPEFSNSLDAMQWAIENNKVVRINYITQGGGRGRGRKLKREMNLPTGAAITRIVEPHHLFQAGTGNLIVVTWDRSIRGIRAFIVDNIVNYIFTGNDFRERMRIIPGNEKGKIAMKNDIFINLKNIGDELQNSGLYESEKVVTTAMKNLLNIKTSQYLGIQGYALRNRRCWDNCYRQKRTTEPTKPAQEVWMSCWDEYLKSINNDTSGWEKYAQDDGFLKEANIKSEQDKFAKVVKNKIKEGTSIGFAVYSTFDEGTKKITDQIIDNSSELLSLAEFLKEEGYNDIGEKLAEVSLEVVKEAGIWQGIKDFVGNLFARKGKLIETLKQLATQSQQLMSIIQKNFKSPTASSDNIIKEAISPEQRDMKNNLVQQYRNTMEQAREAVTFISGLAAKENPRVQQMVQPALVNLQNVVNKSDQAFSQGAISFGDMYNSLQGLYQGATTAMNSVYNIPEESKPGMEEAGLGADQDGDGVPNNVDIDDNANNIPDSQEAAPITIDQLKETNRDVIKNQIYGLYEKGLITKQQIEEMMRGFQRAWGQADRVEKKK